MRGVAATTRIALAAAAVIVGLSATTQARAASPGLVTDLTWGISNADQDRTVAAMSDAGAKWTRLSIQWKAWETSPGTYASWEVARTDRAVQLSRAAGIHVLIDVVNAPAWASNTDDDSQGNVPRNDADFANFMRFVATRYRGQVEAYEIWNEPDIQRFWNTGPNPAAYTALLRAGSNAVRQADPSALVVAGALSWDYTNFLGAMYDDGAKGLFDVLSIHTYPTHGLAGWRAYYGAARLTELAHGDSKPVWFTEFGFNTSTDESAWQPGVSLAEQARLVTEALTTVQQDPWVQVVFYYGLRNTWWDDDDTANMEAQFGLLYTTFAPKPAYYAFKAYATGAGEPPGDARPNVRLTAPANGRTFTRTLVFSATASDDHGVKAVRFLVDGTEVGRDTKAPYSFRWNVPARLAYGAHTVSAVAVDTAGQTSTASASVVRLRASDARRRLAFRSHAWRLRARHLLRVRVHEVSARSRRR